MNHNITTVGVIGTGHMAKDHYIPALCADPRVKIGAFVDRDPVNLAWMMHSQPIFAASPPAQFSDTSDLLTALARGDLTPLDAVFVLTHVDAREDIVTSMITASPKPAGIMCEKPYTLTPASAARMNGASRAAGVKVVVNHQYAVFTRTFEDLYAAELRGQTTRGLMKWVRVHERRQGPYALPTRGGLTFDLVPHVAMPWLDALGYPAIMAAEPVSMPEAERLVHVQTHLTTADGVEVEVDVSDMLATQAEGTALMWRAGEPFELYMRLPTREYDTNAFRPSVSHRQYGLPFRSRIQQPPPPVAQMTAANVTDFISVVRGERDVAATGLTTAEQAAEVTTTVALVGAAHELRRPITPAELDAYLEQAR